MPPMFLLSGCWKPGPSAVEFATPDDKGLPGGLLCLHLSHGSLHLTFKKWASSQHNKPYTQQNLWNHNF